MAGGGQNFFSWGGGQLFKKLIGSPFLTQSAIFLKKFCGGHAPLITGVAPHHLRMIYFCIFIIKY